MPGLISPEQEQAIARRGEPLLVAAGAGSGKTAVLVERFVRAVREDALPPTAILAITFTESAAAEVKERVRARLLELGERAAAAEMGAAFVSTFHAFCARLLRAHPLGAGLEPGFEILDEGLAGRAAEHAFADALRAAVAARGEEAVDLLAAYGPDRLRAMVLRVHSELRARGQRRPRLPQAILRAGEGEAARACALLDDLLRGFGERYDERKRARGALDFDDLELCALQLLREHEQVRALWSRRFELLMVDEFQDTNPRQLALLGALERDNLFTVGDELQAIYGFRDADVGLFRARRAELAADARSLSLTRNYRSRPGLLEVVNEVFEARLQGVYTPLVAARQGEQAVDTTARPGDPEVELLLVDKDRCARGEGPGAGSAGALGGDPALWRVAEARMLAGRVAELVQRDEVQPGKIAVLLRALGDAEVYERALRDRGLQTLAPVGGFWGCAEVCDLLVYLRALANPLDEVALHATLACPLVGVSSNGLVHLARFAAEAGKPVWSAMREHAGELERLLDAGDARRVGTFTRCLEDERAGARGRSIARLIERALDASGHGAELPGPGDAARALANVRKLVGIARRFEASEGRDLRGFLDYAAHQQQSAAAREADAATMEPEGHAVRLMSIHAAKGLEFDVVCLADLGRAPNLGVGDLLVDGERVGLRLARLDGGEAVRALDFDALSEERRRAQAEEEERILYVAMTRARERLLLSGAVSFARWPDARQGAAPLAWLGPALSGRIPEIACAHAAGAGDAVHDIPIGAGAGADGKERLRVRLGPQAEAAAGDARRPPAASSPQRPARAEWHGPAEGPAALQPPPPFAQPELPIASPESALRAAQPDLPIAVAEPARTSDDLLRGISVLSYSALHRLERCGYRFYLERILGLPEEAAAHGSGMRRGLEARARGMLVHRLLESVDFADPSPPQPGGVAAIARRLGVEASRAECERISALMSGMLCDGAPACARLRARVAAASRIRREHPFAFSLGADAPLVAGVLDLLAREDDGCALVIDYKTDQLAEGEDVRERVEREYALQRHIYALALLRDGAPQVEVVHWFWQRPQEPAGVRYGAAQREALESELTRRLRAVRVRGHSVSSHPHRALCEGCPGRGGLCSWSEAETGRERAAERGRKGVEKGR